MITEPPEHRTETSPPTSTPRGIMRLRFISSTPMNVFEGSGTYVGINVLAKALRSLGVDVEVVTPHFPCPNLTLRRLLFNQYLRTLRANADVTVGFDMDGYTIARHGLAREAVARDSGANRRPGSHVASIKGVIADEMRFESGWTRATMGIQASCERKHVHGADLVITTSEYAARRIQELYAVGKRPRIVPELIDLSAWNQLISTSVPSERPKKFVVLTVCRFYPRKRLPVLLAAAERLRARIPEIEFRIVGGGPEEGRLRQIWRRKGLEDAVVWLKDISRAELAREYVQCDVFCLPSVQEGFGIVFLEAMATGKPIVAARAAAVPEVVAHGLLVEPENDEELAAAIEQLHRGPLLRQARGEAGQAYVRQFDVSVVARTFLRELESSLHTGRESSPECA